MGHWPTYFIGKGVTAINANGLWVTKIIYSPFFFDWIFAYNACKRNTKPTAAPGNTIAKCRERVRGIKESITPKGVISLHHRHQNEWWCCDFASYCVVEWRMTGITLLHHRPSKRMMAPQFRVVLCGGMADDGGNFAAPSPTKTNDGVTISRCIVRWKSQPEVTDDGRFWCKLSAIGHKKGTTFTCSAPLFKLLKYNMNKFKSLFCYEGEALVSQNLQVALLL